MSNFDPISEELNATLKNTIVKNLLSQQGRRFFFPKGIVAQAQETKKYNCKLNATAGIAIKNNELMYIPVIKKYINELKPEEIFSYAPTAGEPELREIWKQDILLKNPDLKNKSFSLPVVTSGITHGISITADLFTEKGDTIILPDLHWDNYSLIFKEKKQTTIQTYKLFNNNNGFNIQGLENEIKQNYGKNHSKKIIILFNFPNNPTGYSPTEQEVNKISELLKKTAEDGNKILAITDDSYFGLFYEKEIYKQSLFTRLADLHNNILAIKIDGATKENLAWGFRIGFITFAGKQLDSGHYNALINKTMGCIRASVSSCSKLSQSLLIRGMKTESFVNQRTEAINILKEKYSKVKEVLKQFQNQGNLSILPFNSGYFMCFKLKKGSSEDLRKILLEKGIGTISLDNKYLRVAYSNTDPQKIEKLFNIIFDTAKNL